MADPGCDFKDSEDAERCGKTPTQILAMGMTAPDPEKGAGHAGTSSTLTSARSTSPSCSGRWANARTRVLECPSSVAEGQVPH